MINRNYAEQFLATQGLSVDGLRDAVPPVSNGELLMLIGSVTEGFANPLSDIDLLVVGERRASGDLVLYDVDFEQTVERIDTTHEVNVEYWSEKDLLDLAQKFERMTDSIEKPEGLDSLVVFNEVQLRLIHCIINGVVLAGSPEKWQSYFTDERMRDYLVLYFISLYYTSAEDAVGQIQDGDMESALANIREAAGFLAGAEVASCGQTNPYPKWRIKQLRRCENEIGEEALAGYFRFLFPARDWPRSAISEAVAFCESRIAAIFQRRPKILPAAAALRARMSFVTSVDT